MALIKPSLDYSDRDFYSLRLRLQGLIRSVFPNWTDFNRANFGNILLEMMAYVGDTLHYYQDKQAGESFWSTLTQRLSGIRQGALIGFEFPGAAAATGIFRITLPYPNASATLTIPIGHRFVSVDPSNPVYYQATAETIIIAGAAYGDVTVEASEAFTATFESTDEPLQVFSLPNTPFLDGSIDSVVRVGPVQIAGVAAGDGDYSLVDSFLGVTSNSKVFLVFVDHHDRAHIRFGDGVTGTVPQGTITVKYKVGGGTEGNAEATSFFTSMDPLVFSDGSPATSRIQALAEISGGVERMSLAEGKEEAPASLSVQQRSVSGPDFETGAKKEAGVARALMATSNEYAGIEENYGILYVVAQGTRLASGAVRPSTPSSTLLTAVRNRILNTQPTTVTFTFDVQAAAFLSVDVSAIIYLRSGSSSTTVATAIRTAIDEFFACQLASALEDDEGIGADNPYMDFGVRLADSPSEAGEVIWSDVFNVIRDVVGVKKVDEGNTGLLLNGARSSVQLLPIHFPKLGTITIYNGDTGELL